MSDFWCVCRKYCNGKRTSIRARSTWSRHLRDADDDDDDDDNSVPCKRNRPADITEQDPNTTSRQGSLASSHNDLPDFDPPEFHPPGPDFHPLEPDFHPAEGDSDPVQHQPDPHLDQPQLPLDRERRHSSLWDLDLDELSNMARLPKLQQDMLFICALREAHLDDGVGLKGKALERLRNPPSYPAAVFFFF